MHAPQLSLGFDLEVQRDARQNLQSTPGQNVGGSKYWWKSKESSSRKANQ